MDAYAAGENNDSGGVFLCAKCAPTVLMIDLNVAHAIWICATCACPFAAALR